MCDVINKNNTYKICLFTISLLSYFLIPLLSMFIFQHLDFFMQKFNFYLHTRCFLFLLSQSLFHSFQVLLDYYKLVHAHTHTHTHAHTHTYTHTHAHTHTYTHTHIHTSNWIFWPLTFCNFSWSLSDVSLLCVTKLCVSDMTFCCLFFFFWILSNSNFDFSSTSNLVLSFSYSSTISAGTTGDVVSVVAAVVVVVVVEAVRGCFTAVFLAVTTGYNNFKIHTHAYTHIHIHTHIHVHLYI